LTDDSLLPAYEQHLLELVAYFQAVGTGYLIEQETKVSTIGLALYDHPQGFLSYLGECHALHSYVLKLKLSSSQARNT
jgi:hypothetical protein